MGWMKGEKGTVHRRDFGETDFNDHKVKFVTERCKGKTCLDIGSVHHNPENYKSKYWLYKAIDEVAEEAIGIDIYHEGVKKLQKEGYDIRHMDAQNFDLGRKFDVIVAGDIIEHISDLQGFIESIKKHMASKSKLLISTPNPWYWRYPLKFMLYGDSEPNKEHTHWQSPSTLKQLLGRYNIEIQLVRFGSRYKKDIFMPLPKRWRHTSFHAECVLKSVEEGD